MKISRWLSTGNLDSRLPETLDELEGALCHQFEDALQNAECGIIICQLEDSTYRKAYVEVNLDEIDEQDALGLIGEEGDLDED